MPYKDPQKRKEYVKKYYKEYFKKHPEKRSLYSLHSSQYQKEYHDKNKINAIAYRKKYYIENRDVFLENRKKYYQENKERIQQRIKQKKKNDPIFKLSYTLRSRFKSAFSKYRKTGIEPTHRCSAVRNLGCSMYDLKKYLEKQFEDGMTWENHGQYGWHIDHKKPLSSFNLLDAEEQKKALHYSNLQPMWWFNNLSKGNRYE